MTPPRNKMAAIPRGMLFMNGGGGAGVAIPRLETRWRLYHVACYLLMVVEELG